MSQSVTPWYMDKALYVTALGMVLPIISKKLGVDLSADKMAGLVVMGVGYVASHKAKSAAILMTEIKTKALAAVTEEKK